MKTRNLTLFDLDGTLLPIDSDHSFGQFLVEQGWVDGAVWGARNDQFYADYLAGQLDQEAYVEFATSGWRHRGREAAVAMRARYMAERLRPTMLPQALELVRRHQAAGDLIAMVTATNRFVTEPIAEAFGIDTLIAVELHRDDEGWYTGAIAGTPSFREGKIVRVEQWLDGMGLHRDDFAQSFCYSDSPNDLPLLEWVSHPVATNPSAQLATIAAQRGWPILRLFSEE
jgi:HAD superfamily hydrolase (TIGR01490 family)